MGHPMGSIHYIVQIMCFQRSSKTGLVPPSTPDAHQPTDTSGGGGLASPLVKQLLASTEQGCAVLETFQQILHQLYHQPHQQGTLLNNCLYMV